MNNKCPTAMKGALNHAKTSFSTEICAGAITSVVQNLAPFGYLKEKKGGMRCQQHTSYCMSTVDTNFSLILNYQAFQPLLTLSDTTTTVVDTCMDKNMH
jgi:hypothetical protein